MRGRGARFGLALLGVGILTAAAPGAAQNGVVRERPDDALSRNLRSLAENPRSLHALMGAGQAALTMGDPQAAVTFFARAEEQAPRDGRIKMWIGSALVQMEQPAGALKFFAEAAALGVAEADIARDRGLAFDISGDPRRAQRDYRLVLRRGADPEVTRRLALSLAVSGEREPALRLLEEQLLVRDRAAERTRALILALTGDAAGATRAVQAAMPGPQANAMASFLARLPGLSLADRALAVHFGRFPGDGRSAPLTTDAYASLDPVVRAGTPDTGQPALGRRTAVPVPVSTAPRRRPGSDDSDSGRALRPAASPDSSAKAPPRVHARAVPVKQDPPVEAKPRPADPSPGPPPQPKAQPVELAVTRLPAAGPPDNAAASAARPDPAPAREEPRSGSRLADIAASIAAIPEDAPPVRTSSAPARPASRAAAAAPPKERARTAAAPAKKKTPPAPPREPARHWVQVAGGANKATLPREYARLKAKAPKLLGARAAWTVPVGATNRLLVGPFAAGKEAQAFVNELAKADLSAFAWSSEAGQKVERLPAK
jgi:Flp pilus assembly protein TadD